MHSLAAWLVRHRQHARQLEVRMGSLQRPVGDADAATAAAAAAVATCLAAASTAGWLEHLMCLGWYYDIEWLAAMEPLQHLQLAYSSSEHAEVAPAISALTTLRSLELSGGRVGGGGEFTVARACRHPSPACACASCGR